MKFFILILSWIVLITADQESPSIFESRFDDVEASTLKPSDKSDVIYQPDLTQNSRPRISFKYEQKSFIDVPHIHAKKENTLHYFRVHKPIERRKIFHISRKNDSLTQAEVVELIDVPSNTYSTPKEYLMKNDTTEDKRDDYILDKLPEVWEVTQDTIVPLSQQKNNEEVDVNAVSKTEAPITDSNQIASALPEIILGQEIISLIQNKEVYGPITETEVNKSQFEKILSENNTELVDSSNSNAQAQNHHLDDATIKHSSTPLIDFFLLSDGGLKWERNDTAETFPKLLIEEVTFEDSPKTNITEDMSTMIYSKSNISFVTESDLRNYTIYSTVSSTSSDELTEKAPTSSVITLPQESNTESRLEGIANSLLSYFSNTGLEEVIRNISTGSNNSYSNVQDYTSVKLEDIISPKSLTRRHRRRKHGKKKTTLSITDVTTTTSSITIGNGPQKLSTEVKVSSPHNDFTHRQDSNFRRRNGIVRVSKPTENLTPSSENLNNTTTNTSPYTQWRAKTKYRKWNRNRNISPTVMNPHMVFPNAPLVFEIPTNKTEYIGNAPSLSATLRENQVSVANDSDNIRQHVDLSKAETQMNTAAATLSPIELPTIKSNPHRMRFRNKVRIIKSTTQSILLTSEHTERATIEVIENKENTMASNQSTGKKFKQPPPPPPTISPWYDGFGK